MLLDLPDVRQDSDHNCGFAAVECALQFLGVRSAAHVLDMSNPIQGTSPDTVEALLRRAKLRVVSGDMNTDDLKHFTRYGRPVLCPVNLFGGHWVVVRGVERSRVHYHCPSDGRKSRPVDTWYDIWIDTTTKGFEYVRWGIAVG